MFSDYMLAKNADREKDTPEQRKAIYEGLVKGQNDKQRTVAQRILSGDIAPFGGASNIGDGTESMLSQDRYGFGLRHDKKAYKGMGFLGDLRDPQGVHMTEYSMGVNFDGEEVEIPSIVPTLTKKELKEIVNNKNVPDTAVQKAVDFARKRIKEGKSVWASEGDRKKYILKMANSSNDEILQLMKSYNKTEDEILNALMRDFLKGSK
jgi:hypothetical protein